MNNKTALLKQAAELGTQAFKAGRGMAPAQSAELMALCAPFMKGTFENPDPKGHKMSMDLMRTYSRAWTAANLAEPIYLDGECINPWVLDAPVSLEGK